jgi:hypothetical protein
MEVLLVNNILSVLLALLWNVNRIISDTDTHLYDNIWLNIQVIDLFS